MKLSRLIYIVTIVLVTAGCSTQYAPEVRLAEVGEGYSSTSVNTAVFRNSSLVTQGGWQFIAYYDAEGYMVLGKRAEGSESWTLQRTQYQGNVNDAHNVISIMLDGDGYVHAAFDHHGSPLKYCRSLAPYSLDLGELEPMTGADEEDVTYPEFYRLPDGDLLFAYRSGASGCGNLVLNRYDVKSRKWSRVQTALIDGEGSRNAYWQLYMDESGTIHLSWTWRETYLVETNHDICYARSADGGRTWFRTDGTQYELPITEANAEYACRVPQNSELMNQTSMSADADGNPYIATYWRDAGSEVPQYRLVYYDGQQWQVCQVMDRTSPFSLKGGGTKMVPIARPRVVVDGSTVLYIFRDEERGNRVSVACAEDLGGGWQVFDLTDFPVGAWEPTIDTELWKSSRKLSVFVQKTMQGDGERSVDIDPQPVYVLDFIR